MNFAQKAALDFFISFGVVFGAAMLGGICAILTFQPPSDTMRDIAEKLKIWAVVAAIGGSIDPIRTIESNFLDGQLSPAIKQIVEIFIAFIGANLGTRLVQWICGHGIQS